MKEKAEIYFRNLSSIFLETVVSDKDNRNFNLYEGIEKAIDLVISSSSAGKKIIFIGNGGSASIASHMATDYFKNGGMKAMCFNDGSQLTCLGNDYGYEHVFEKPVEMYTEKGDILVAISSSGKSRNILNAVNAAKGIGCRIITMSGFEEDNPLRFSGCELNFYVPSESYGFVEIAHLCFCHSILDLIIEQRKKRAKCA